jgi:hypothetical protein
MKVISIKFYGVNISVPSEILLLRDYKNFRANTHLILEKGLMPFSKYNKTMEERFIVLRKNGTPSSGQEVLTVTDIHQLEFKECSLEKFYKFRAFL